MKVEREHQDFLLIDTQKKETHVKVSMFFSLFYLFTMWKFLNKLSPGHVFVCAAFSCQTR